MKPLLRLVTCVWAIGFAFPWSSPADDTKTNPWSIQVIDQNEAGKFSALKIDRDGNAHLAYIGDESHSLKYAYWDHATKHWFTMVVAQGTSFCDLALDSKQRPHISYADYGTGSGAQLHHVFWDGTAWQNIAVPLKSEVIAYFTSIALDANDYPTISFYEYRGARGTDLGVRMRVVTWNGTFWEAQTIDSDNQSGKFNALAIDAQGHKHLAYANVSALIGGVRYAEWDNKVNRPEIVDDRSSNSSELVGHSIWMALDKDGNPHLTYMNYSNPTVKYAVRKGGHWTVQSVDRLVGTAYPDRNSIAIGPNGEPYLGYYDSGRATLRVAHHDRDRWLVETVDGGGAGMNSSMQIADGVIWISYCDESNNMLKVARRDISPSTPTVPEVPKATAAKE